jgi:hypothetical protein
VQVAVEAQLHNDGFAIYMRRSNNLHAGERGKEDFFFANKLCRGKRKVDRKVWRGNQREKHAVG